MYYPNLRAEIMRKGMTVSEFAENCGFATSTFSYKLSDRSPFLLEEAIKIRTALGVDMSLEKLFEKEVTGCEE